MVGYTLEEMKDLILWCKDQKIKSVSIGELEVHFAEHAWSQPFPDESPLTSEEIERKAQKAFEDVLFHSA